jgi:hypothetical protein
MMFPDSYPDPDPANASDPYPIGSCERQVLDTDQRQQRKQSPDFNLRLIKV